MIKQLNQQTHCSWCGTAVTYPSEWMSLCPHCGFKNYLSPKPCANLYIVRDDKVALLKRAIEPAKGKYDCPGGFMDTTDYSIEACAYRELQEELGVTHDKISSLEYIGSFMNDYVWQGTIVPCAVACYICKLKDYTFTIDQSENTALEWFTADDVPTIDYAWEGDKKMLTQYYNERRLIHGSRHHRIYSTPN